MGNSLVKSFSNSTFNTNLTVIMIGDQIWFIAKEVADTLDYCSVQKALQSVKDKYKKVLSYEECNEVFRLTEMVNLTVQSMSQGLKLINKSGLIQLVLNSTKPEAEAFQDWVLEDVIPQVLEKGSYGVNQLSIKQQNILKLFDNKTSDADKAIALKEIVDEETSTANKRAFTSMGRLGGVTTALNAAKEALNTANETIKSIASEFNDLKESIGQSEEWQSSAQLMNNYPEVFGTFKSTNSLTRYLKKRNVLHKLSDHPDSSGYLFTIFKVEEAMNVVK